MNKSNPIGVFDSGIGGLTVVKQLKQFLPKENIVYFGDTARVPYGTKSNSTVIEYALQDAQFLINKNVKLIVVACNTVSSVALDVLREKFSVPIIGMILPGAKMAEAKSKNKHVGVIGTEATVSNAAYSKELLKLDEKIRVYEKACPLFVPLAEEGWLEHPATELIAEEYLAELRAHGIDTLILGCTHYPLLRNLIQRVIGEEVELIDSGTAAAVVVEDYLRAGNLLNDSATEGNDLFFVSDMPAKFKLIAERFLGRKITNLQKIDLEEELKRS
jgi:glutamate racemase